MYVTGLFLGVNRSGFATVTVSNNFSISLPFYDLPSFLDSPSPIHIWFCQGWLLVPYSNKHCTCSLTDLVASEISFPLIFQHWMDPCSWTKKDDTYSRSISCLLLIFWPISLLLYTLRECFTNIASARIQSYSQSSSISTWPADFQYFLISIIPSFFAASRSALFIA